MIRATGRARLAHARPVVHPGRLVGAPGPVDGSLELAQPEEGWPGQDGTQHTNGAHCHRSAYRARVTQQSSRFQTAFRWRCAMLVCWNPAETQPADRMSRPGLGVRCQAVTGVQSGRTGRSSGEKTSHPCQRSRSSCSGSFQTGVSFPRAPGPGPGQPIEGGATCMALSTVHMRMRGLIRQTLTGRSGSPESLLRCKPTKFTHCVGCQRRSGGLRPGFGPVIFASHRIDEIGMGPRQLISSGVFQLTCRL